MDNPKIIGVHQRKLADGSVWERKEVFTTPRISRDSIISHINAVKNQYEPHGYIIMEDEIEIWTMYGTTDIKLNIPIYQPMEMQKHR